MFIILFCFVILMWTCTNTVWRKQSSLPEENQVHHGTPGLLSDALGRIVDIGNQKTGFREKANSRCLELCHRRVPLMFFHDAQAELILSLRGCSRTRAEPREQPKGKIMGSLISQKLSWRITSCERFYKKWFSLREAELLPDFAQHRFQSYRPDNWGTDWNFCTGETACWSGQYEQMTRFLIQIFDTYFWTNTVRSCVLSCHVYMYSHNTANKKNKQFVFSENHSEEFIIHNDKKKWQTLLGILFTSNSICAIHLRKPATVLKFF